MENQFLSRGTRGWGEERTELSQRSESSGNISILVLTDGEYVVSGTEEGGGCCEPHLIISSNELVMDGAFLKQGKNTRRA